MIPLHCGARYGSVKMTRILLAAGANVCARGEKGETALLWATEMGYDEKVNYDEVVRLLLQNNATIDERDHEYATPLI